jgi:UDP-3-O-[3-hydroxymyristoyl] glucosamine N-acyltransferase
LSGIRLSEPVTVAALARRFGGVPDPPIYDRGIRRIVSPVAAEADDDLVLMISARQLRGECPDNGVYLCSDALAARLPIGRRWAHSHALWVVAKLLEAQAEALKFKEGVRAVHVEAGADIARDAVLEPGVVVQRGVRIGSGCSIGANAVLYSGVTLGQRVVIGAGAVLGRQGFGFTESPAGERVRIPHLGGVLIDDEVEIGALCSVDAGVLGPTRIRKGTKIDAHVHVAHNVDIGPNCLIAAQSGFAGSVSLGAGVLVGGQSGVTDHATIGRGARLAAKSGVVGDIDDGVTVAGFPAVPRVRWLRAMAALLARHARATTI